MANKSSSASPANRSARVRNGLVWLVAIALGAATIYETAGIFHDNSQRDERARLLLFATANRISDIAATRLELLGRDAVACQCSDALAISEFFALTPPDTVVTRRPSTGAVNATPLASDQQLIRISRLQAAQRRIAGQRRIRLTSAAPISNALIASTIEHPAGTTATSNRVSTVHGFVVDAGSAAIALFGGLAERAPTTDPTSTANPGDVFAGALARDSTGKLNTVIALDSVSFQVVDRNGTVLFGAIDSTRSIHANMQLSGALEPFTLRLTLWPWQFTSPLLGGIQPERLWPIGQVGVAALLMLALAVSMTRREAMLARARSDFIAGVSHELRMPLAQILLSGETLAMHRERDQAERDSLAASVVREARRLVGLVDNVLFFARSGTVALKPHLQRVSVAEVLTDACEAVQLVAEDAGQKIVIDEPSNVFVLTDRQLLRQAIVNLLDNAVKYGREAQTIHVHAQASSSSAVRIMVDDQGAGIPLADRARLLEPYERLIRDQMSERTGTGLGLSIVRDVARASKGKAWLDDAPGGGTRAVIELPSANAT